MIANQIKVEILKEVLIKSGFDKDKNVIDSMAECVMNDRFLFELENNEVIAFVTWEKPQEVDSKKWVFVNNLWIDSRYRNRDIVIRIRTQLRNILKDTRATWFNRKKQKSVDRR